MERSDMNWTIETQYEDPKARYDRYVCAVASGCLSDNHDCTSVDGMAEIALNIMLAADKRWEEYTKGGEDAI